jgi:hypothetical protein
MSDSPLEVQQSGDKVVVEGKEVKGIPTEDELIERLNSLGSQMRELIVHAKRLPRKPGLEPYQDQVRALAISQSYLQTGFMWMRRCISPTKDF